MIADSGGQKFVEAPFENIVYGRRDGHSNPGYCPTRWGDSAQLCHPCTLLALEGLREGMGRMVPVVATAAPSVGVSCPLVSSPPRAYMAR